VPRTAAKPTRPVAKSGARGTVRQRPAPLSSKRPCWSPSWTGSSSTASGRCGQMRPRTQGVRGAGPASGRGGRSRAATQGRGSAAPATGAGTRARSRHRAGASQQLVPPARRDRASTRSLTSRLAAADGATATGHLSSGPLTEHPRCRMSLHPVDTPQLDPMSQQSAATLTRSTSSGAFGLGGVVAPLLRSQWRMQAPRLRRRRSATRVGASRSAGRAGWGKRPPRFRRRRGRSRSR